MACEQLLAAYNKAYKQYLADLASEKTVDSVPLSILRAAGAKSYYAGLAYHYCISQSLRIQPLFDLSGQWSYDGVPGPVVSVAMNSISIDMSAYNRPTAFGMFLDQSDITVTFPDDKTYTGKLVRKGVTGQYNPPEFIMWSNNSEWSKYYQHLVNKGPAARELAYS